MGVASGSEAKTDGGEVDAKQQRAPVVTICETARELNGSEMFGTLHKLTSTDEWRPLWFVLKDFVLYIFKRKPEPHER